MGVQEYKLVDPLGLWDVTVVVSTDKKGKKSYRIFATQSDDDDDGGSLAHQLGLIGSDATAFAANVNSILGSTASGAVRLSESSDKTVKDVYNKVKGGLNEQAKWESGNADKIANNEQAGPTHTNCAKSAAEIGKIMELTRPMHPANFDPELEQRANFSFNPRVGDVMRFANPNSVAAHFGNLIFRNTDGTPLVFSKSGTKGPFEITNPTDLRQNNGYPYVSGYYRAKTEK
jgi:hypothetical protein